MHFHVLAFDLDGTLAMNDHIEEETWSMLRKAKSAGVSLLLVTGRRLDALAEIRPFEELFKAIVAENGAVVYLPEREAVLTPFGTLQDELLDKLTQSSMPLELGKVIAATWVPHDQEVLRILSKTGSPATLEYNKGAVMVLPPGATKGTGLLIALQELGYSAHNVIGCGGGENDRSFFEQVEVAVAVANATPEIKKMADIILQKANGAGVRLLIKKLLNGKISISKRRNSHLLELGKTSQGESFDLDPLTLLTKNIAIAGSSGTGKSWLAGLLVEKLLQREYQLCIIDPEGDYGGIRAFPHTLLLGGRDMSPPPVGQVITLLKYTHLSLILDLSLYTLEEKTSYLTSLLQSLNNLRQKRGKPHWLLIDEAHYFCYTEGLPLTDLIVKEMEAGGIGIISYRPSLLADSVVKSVHSWMFTQIKNPDELNFLQEFMDVSSSDPTFSQLSSLPSGKVFLCLDQQGKNETTCPVIIQYQTNQRVTPHVRHLHKYLRAPLPASKRFYFRTDDSYRGQKTASNFGEFFEALGRVPLNSLQYHLENKHFEQWLTKVLHDKELARLFRKIARRKLTGELLRNELVSTTKKRYDKLEKLT